MRLRAGLGAAAAMLTASTVLLGAVPASAATTGITATTLKTIKLPGVGGHGDVVTADPQAHRIYIAQSPDNNVIVIDTLTNRIVAVIGDIAQANGIAYNRDYVFVAEATTNQIAVISKATWQVVATVSSGGKTPDAIYYDSRNKTVFVADDDTNNMEEFSAEAPFTVTGSFGLQPTDATAGPDLGVYVRKTNTIYQSDDNDVNVIDAGTRAIKKVFSLPLAAGVDAKDMYYDHQRDELWIGTTGDEVLAINPDTGAVVANVRTEAGADQVSGDARQHLLFLGEEKAGVVGVVDLDTHQALADIKTEIGTHTLAYLPHTDRVYVYRDESNAVDVVRIRRDHD